MAMNGMDTAPLKVFAVWARKDLIRGVAARVAAVLAPGSSERVEQVRAVAALESAVAASGGGEVGRGLVAERVAYTWFNRIIALRFMDANGYTGEGVVSPASGLGVGQPEVLAGAKRGAIDESFVGNSVKVAVSALLDGSRVSPDPQGEAYGLLLAEYCRYWNRAMPFMFEREGDFTELLMPSNLLAEGSILDQSVKVLTEDVCKDVEVIGWLYQFYISDRKDEVFAGFKKNKKAGPDEIPAATQLFTPHWIVRYLVENSLGRLWMLNRPTSGLVERMDYYIAPVDEETDFLKVNSPEELKIIDPACGSGHMLTYAFDLLYAIYEEEGYAPADIPELILTNNLYGTEIDQRAGSLAAFALMMKARAKQRTFFNKQIQPNICVIEPISFSPDELEFLLTTNGDHDAERIFWNLFTDADTLGALIQPDPAMTIRLAGHLETLDDQSDMYKVKAIENAQRVITQAEYLTPRYHVVVANPPYMGGGNLNNVAADFARREYILAKTDLFAMFIQRCLAAARPRGIVAMVTQDSWMFLSAYSKYREWFLCSGSLQTLAHLGTAAFESIGGEVVSAVAFTIKAVSAGPERASFIRATEESGEAKADVLLSVSRGGASDRIWRRATEDFLSLPNNPVIYWATDDEVAALCEGPYVGELIQAREGMATGSNDTFLRRWFEVSVAGIALGVTSTEDPTISRFRWFPYQKGGPSRRWYGNFDFVVDWEDDGARQRENVDPVSGRVRSHNYNGDYAFRRGFTWSAISGDGFAVRHVEGGFMFDGKGPMAFPISEDDLLFLEGFLNSSTATRYMRLLAPRLDFRLGHVLSLPIRVVESSSVTRLVEQCIALSKQDWDSCELSIDFVASPIIGANSRFESALDDWLSDIDDSRRILATTEEKIDAIFSGAYRSSGHEIIRHEKALDLEPWRRAVVEDFISYAVGCMFGRYSLDAPGLILADQGSTVQDYLEKIAAPGFLPDADNVIPIIDGDWFEDDIVARFREFIRVAFGEQHFEENLRFIAEALEVRDLRDYFVKSFYKDHVQRYKKRPIYWMFSSPKGSFNALIYMHRYTPSTVSTVLNEYLREFQAKLRASLENAERTNNAREADRLRKVLTELDEYEHDILYPLASQNIAIDLDDGVKVNYPKFGAALKKIPGLEATE